MDDFKRRMELARQVGRLRGAIEGCLYCYEDRMPSAAIRELRRVLEDTKDEPIGGEIPVEHNGATQVGVTGGIVGDE